MYTCTCTCTCLSWRCCIACFVQCVSNTQCCTCTRPVMPRTRVHGDMILKTRPFSMYCACHCMWPVGLDRSKEKPTVHPSPTRWPCYMHPWPGRCHELCCSRSEECSLHSPADIGSVSALVCQRGGGRGERERERSNHRYLTSLPRFRVLV